MAIQIALKNPQTGEIKLVKVGFSWLLFFLSNVFGIPLFERKLTTWGFVFLAMNGFALVCQIASQNPAAQVLGGLVVIAQIVLAFYMGFKGNELTAKNHLAKGWQFTEANSEMTRYAKQNWHIFEPVSVPPSQSPGEVSQSQQ